MSLLSNATFNLNHLNKGEDWNTIHLNIYAVLKSKDSSLLEALEDVRKIYKDVQRNARTNKLIDSTMRVGFKNDEVLFLHYNLRDREPNDNIIDSDDVYIDMKFIMADVSKITPIKNTIEVVLSYLDIESEQRVEFIRYISEKIRYTLSQKYSSEWTEECVPVSTPV